MNTLQFSYHLVPYEMFIKDLASQIVRLLKEDSNDPEFISQRKAFELFGRRNIERWKKLGLVEGFRKPGRLDCRPAIPAALSAGLSEGSSQRSQKGYK